MTLHNQVRSILARITSKIQTDQSLSGPNCQPLLDESTLVEPPNLPDKEALKTQIKSFPYWYQRIYLGQGIYTVDTPMYHESVWRYLRPALPDNLQNASALDVGTNAGFFSIQAKLLGAGRVVGIESVDDYMQQAELCRDIWGLDIEYKAIDAHQIDTLRETFDIIIFTGILYHLKNPLQVLEDVSRVCQDAIVVETEVLSENRGNRVFVRQGPFGKVKVTERNTGMMKFIEADEMNGDGSNWWVPDTECVKGMLRTAGFRYFSEPCYLLENRLLMIASKKPTSTLKLQAFG